MRNRRFDRKKPASPRQHARDSETPPRRMVSVDPDAQAEYDASSAIAKVNTFDELSYGKAFIIGIFQSLAIVPDVAFLVPSSSVLCLWARRAPSPPSSPFFLAIPIMLGWSVLKFIKHGFAYAWESDG